MQYPILANQIAKAAPTRQRADDGEVSYAKALEADLRKYVEGDGAFDAGSPAMYSTDSSNYRQVPIGVVAPKTIDDVISAVAAARRYGAPTGSTKTSVMGTSHEVSLLKSGRGSKFARLTLLRHGRKLRLRETQVRYIAAGVPARVAGAC